MAKIGNKARQAPAPEPEEEEEEASAAKGKQVAKTEKAPENSSLAVASSVAARMAKAAGQGATESMGAKDYAIPFLKVLDKGSPIVIEGSDEYVEGAKAGMLFNTVTKELFPKTGAIVIPCGFKSVILEWESTEPGSGFVGEHLASSDIKTKSGGSLQEMPGGAKRFVMPNGHCLQDANNYYCILVKENGDTEPVIISMTGSNLTVSRLWNSMMANRKMMVNGRRMTAPSFGVQYLMKSKPMTDGKYHWHVFDPEDAGLVDDGGLLDVTESFYETVTAGKVKGNYNSTGGVDASPSKDAASNDGNRDHIPELGEGDDIPY
jgi:hypothetical protein